MRRETGFTLIEIMLVLVLLSVSSMAVIIGLPESQDDQVKEEASRFYRLIQTFSDDALLNGMMLGVYFDETNQEYSAMLLMINDWKLFESPNLTTEVSMNEDVEFEMELGGSVWTEDDDRLFNPDPLFDDEMFEDENKEIIPQVILSSSGEITPFSIRFFPADDEGVIDDRTWMVRGDESGNIVLLKPGEEVDENGDIIDADS